MCKLFDHIPTACPLCRQRAFGGRLCVGCLADLDAFETGASAQRCLYCGLAPLSPHAPCWTCLRSPPPFCRVIVAMPYAWPYAHLLAQLKREHRLWMARTLGHLLARAVVASQARSPGLSTPLPVTVPRPSVIVPVPSARASLLRRGFNPAAEIARATGARLSLPVWVEAMCRVREAPKQSGLGRPARLRAVAGAFEVCADVRERHVALVDDVMTTGATAEATTHALLAAGAASVGVWTVARRAR